MNVTRNGKIARLPRAVRLELNRRLADGEQGKKLVVWLNALPDVQAIVAAEFGGKAIREQNLSEWKQGGYRDWQAQQEALEIVERLSEEAAQWDAEGRAPITETLAHWAAARYAVATRRVAEAGDVEGWRLLRELCSDIVELRKGDHSAERLQIDRERLKLEKEKSEKQVSEKVARLVEEHKASGPSQEEQAQRLREIFKFHPKEKERAGFRPRRSRKLKGPRKYYNEPENSDGATVRRKP
jgi:hypothetical protein